jgi:hypothetical protein
MISRQRLPHRPGTGTGKARSAPPIPPMITLLPAHTVPLPPVPAPGDEEAAILGFPADVDDDGAGQQLAARLPDLPRPDTEPHLVARRRAEWFGGIALLLAAVAADASLWLPWWRGSGADGLTLARQGFAILGSGIAVLGRSGLWEPVVVLVAGGVLLVLGLLLFHRARSHRLVGVLALLVTVAAAAGIVVPLADADWSTRSFGPGMWLATAVVLLGTIGALKAMLTEPVISTEPR